MVQNIRKNEFESVIKSSKPVLADFYAEWCSPCKMLAPTIEEIHNEYNDYFETVKVNVDENPELTEYYGVSGIPALLLFKDGKEILRMSGVQTKERIISVISEKMGESLV
ncbi:MULTISPECIES: thioredoxin [Ruminococcus]|uniref:thioredoxin n=1 Tax=Ruminococcus TaxID=1263 RepID=UPI0025DCD247|nr:MULTISPECIES: thioredoxin [Ruminococcus]